MARAWLSFAAALAACSRRATAAGKLRGAPASGIDVGRISGDTVVGAVGAVADGTGTLAVSGGGSGDAVGGVFEYFMPQALKATSNPVVSSVFMTRRDGLDAGRSIKGSIFFNGPVASGVMVFLIAELFTDISGGDHTSNTSSPICPFI